MIVDAKGQFLMKLFKMTFKLEDQAIIWRQMNLSPIGIRIPFAFILQLLRRQMGSCIKKRGESALR